VFHIPTHQDVPGTAILSPAGHPAMIRAASTQSSIYLTCSSVMLSPATDYGFTELGQWY